MRDEPPTEMVSVKPGSVPAVPAVHSVSVPDHEMLGSIGKGTFGEVWLARNAVGTFRAVKVVRRNNFSEAYPFEREFTGIQKYEPISRSHDGLIDILQIGRNDEAGYFYYVMELADDASGSHLQTTPDSALGRAQLFSPSGPAESSTPNEADRRKHEIRPQEYVPKTLRSGLRQQVRLAPTECLRIGLSLSSALEYLHRQGLVHRDIKPSNIIFVHSAPKLADLGLVADADEARSFVGTIGFIPPEGPGTAQADVYGLGKVPYEILTGKDRQEFPSLPAEFQIKTCCSGDDTADGEARLLIELNQVILKACESNPRLRYRSAQAMHNELVLLKSGHSVMRTRSVEGYWRACKNAGSGMILAGVILMALFFLFRQDSADLQSPIEEVNELIERGNLTALSSTPERLDQAWRYFGRAVELDPKSVPAYIGQFQVRLSQWGALVVNHPTNVDSNLRTAATNLIGIAANLGEAKLASSILRYLDGRLDLALEEVHQATQMRMASQNGAGTVHCFYGWYLMNAGRTDAALHEYLLAERAFPSSPRIQFQLGHPYFAQHNFDLALAHYQKSIDLEPRQYHGYHCKGSVYEEKGEFEKAIKAFATADLMAGKSESTTKVFYEELLTAAKLDPIHGYWRKQLETAMSKPTQDPHDIAVIFAHLGRMDEAYDWLNKACQRGRVENLWADVCWDHKDERFKRIADTTGMKP